MCKAEERFKSPPILPPHLLQVILNKDTGISVSTGACFAEWWPRGCEQVGNKPGHGAGTGKETPQSRCHVCNFLITYVQMDPSEVKLFFYLTVFKIEKETRWLSYSPKPESAHCDTRKGQKHVGSP